MRLEHAEYQHPTQASRVGLNVFEQPAGGFLVTEEWKGTATVVKTLGFFDAREAATGCVRRREAELRAQGFQRLTAAA
jgi:hypothetical protein